MKNIDTNEVKRILEMHSKLKKKPILEQNAPDEDNDANPNVSGVNPTLKSTPKVTNDNSSVIPKVNQDEVDLKLIRDAVTAKCLKNGKAQYLKGTKKPVYVVTTAKSGKVVVFYPDMTYKFVDGSKSGKWKCDGLQALANQAQQTATQQTTVDADIAREIEQNNYQRIEDINVTPSELAQLYEKHPKYNLWRLKFKTSKSGGFTEEQKAFIKQWTDDQNRNGKPGFVATLTPEQRAKGTFKAIKVSGTEQLFPNGGLTMYREPAVASNDIKSCKEAIEKYYTYWREDSEELTDSEFNSLKPFVQSCANRYHKRWGGVFSSIDNYVKILTGDEPGGPSSYGSDSKFRLKSPKNVRR